MSVKGGFREGKLSLDGFDCSYESVKEELEKVRKYLAPKDLDMFEVSVAFEGH